MVCTYTRGGEAACIIPYVFLIRRIGMYLHQGSVVALSLTHP